MQLPNRIHAFEECVLAIPFKCLSHSKLRLTP